MPDAQPCRFIKATSISLKANFEKSESLCHSSNKSHYPISTVLKISPKVLVINTLPPPPPTHGTEHTLYGVILGTLSDTFEKSLIQLGTVRNPRVLWAEKFPCKCILKVYVPNLIKFKGRRASKQAQNSIFELRDSQFVS